MPKFSYVVSTYNAADYLPGLVRDLSLQSDNDHEVIIVDSCSADDTEEVVARLRSQDSRVVYHRQNERTPYGVSWLKGWEMSNGLVVANSNTDDRSHPWRSVQVGVAAYEASRRDGILRQEKYRFYYGGYETRRDNVVVAKGVPPRFSVDDFQQYFRCGPHIHWDNKISGIVDWNRMYDAAFKLRSAFDYWMVLYFISLGVTGVNIPSCFTIYNQRDDSIEQSDKDRSSFESLYAIEEFFPESPAIKRMYSEGGDYLARYEEFKRGLTNV
jgi:glycosyltransferase involved in cell wall biosynthesis